MQNTHYRTNFTAKELTECLDWMEQHIGELPATAVLPAMKLDDVHRTVRRMVTVLRPRIGNRTFYGQFAMLMYLREQLAPAAATAGTTTAQDPVDRQD